MFTAPLFLIAAAVGATIPLLLHVIQSRQRITMPFPTLRFLKLADQKSSRRAKMDHILLWLIRTLIMILLGCAFAMPTLRLSQMSWLGQSPRDIAIVIDASYSMDYRKGQKTAWEDAKSTAASLLEGLGESDRYCIFIAGEQPEAIVPEPTGSIEDGLAQINALEFKLTTSSLAPALQAAHEALQKSTRGREKEIYLLTDNQALPWTGFGQPTVDATQDADAVTADSNRWDPSTLDPDTSIFVAMLGVTAPENAGPSAVVLDPPVLFGNAPAELSVQLNRGGLAEPVTVILSIDDREIGRRSFVAGAQTDPTFPIPPLEPGIHTGRLDTPEDNLVIDNTFHFLIQVQDKLPTLIVGEDSDTVFVRAALKAGARRGLDSNWITPDKLPDEILHQYSVVLLCNALPLPDAVLTQLEHYGKAGGLLAFFPGDSANLTDYQALPWLPAQPTAVQELGIGRRNRTLTWDQPFHPLVAPLRSGLTAPNITLRRHLAWQNMAEDTETLISSGADEPFLLDRPLGRGRVLMTSVSADRTWSEFPLSPFFLPVVHQIAEYSSGLGGTPPFIWADHSVSLGMILPQATRESTIVNPEGRPVVVRATIVEGQTILSVEDVDVPGIYTISGPGFPDTRPALAVNIPREEANLMPLPADQVKDLIGVESVYLAADPEELLKHVQDHRIGRTYGEHLLWLALFLIIIEFTYANMLAKGGTSLIGQLKLEASGKVGGSGA